MLGFAKYGKTLERSSHLLFPAASFSSHPRLATPLRWVHLHATLLHDSLLSLFFLVKVSQRLVFILSSPVHEETHSNTYVLVPSHEEALSAPLEFSNDAAHTVQVTKHRYTHTNQYVTLNESI